MSNPKIHISLSDNQTVEVDSYQLIARLSAKEIRELALYRQNIEQQLRDEDPEYDTSELKQENISISNLIEDICEVYRVDRIKLKLWYTNEQSLKFLQYVLKITKNQTAFFDGKMSHDFHESMMILSDYIKPELLRYTLPLEHQELLGLKPLTYKATRVQTIALLQMTLFINSLKSSFNYA